MAECIWLVFRRETTEIVLVLFSFFIVEQSFSYSMNISNFEWNRHSIVHILDDRVYIDLIVLGTV